MLIEQRTYQLKPGALHEFQFWRQGVHRAFHPVTLGDLAERTAALPDLSIRRTVGRRALVSDCRPRAGQT